MHEDWVAAISGAWPRALATGSYDGVARLWDARGVVVAELRGHTGGVTDITVTAGPSSDADADAAIVLTASKDGTARVWPVRLPPARRGAAAAAAAPLLGVQASAVLEGHTAGLEAIAAAPDGAHAATAGWDGTLRLFSLAGALEPGAPAAAAAAAGAAGGKRRKKGGEGGGAAAVGVSIAAEATLGGHAGCVSCVTWPERGALFSGGWDHTLRRWDAEAQACTQTLNNGGAKAVFALDCRPGAMLLAFGGAERAVRCWDPRASSTVATLALASHCAWVTAVRWCPWQEHHLLSASYDGSMKLWDVRAAVPLHSTPASAEKLLAADWWRAPPGEGAASRRVACGGADAALHIYAAKPQAGA